MPCGCHWPGPPEPRPASPGSGALRSHTYALYRISAAVVNCALLFAGRHAERKVFTPVHEWRWRSYRAQIAQFCRRQGSLGRTNWLSSCYRTYCRPHWT